MNPDSPIERPWSDPTAGSYQPVPTSDSQPPGPTVPPIRPATEPYPTPFPQAQPPPQSQFPQAQYPQPQFPPAQFPPPQSQAPPAQYQPGQFIEMRAHLWNRIRGMVADQPEFRSVPRESGFSVG